MDNTSRSDLGFLYELRLRIGNIDKNNFTKKEILEIFDQLQLQSSGKPRNNLQTQGGSPVSRLLFFHPRFTVSCIFITEEMFWHSHNHNHPAR